MIDFRLFLPEITNYLLHFYWIFSDVYCVYQHSRQRLRKMTRLQKETHGLSAENTVREMDTHRLWYAHLYSRVMRMKKILWLRLRWSWHRSNWHHDIRRVTRRFFPRCTPIRLEIPDQTTGNEAKKAFQSKEHAIVARKHWYLHHGETVESKLRHTNTRTLWCVFRHACLQWKKPMQVWETVQGKRTTGPGSKQGNKRVGCAGVRCLNLIMTRPSELRADQTCYK